MLEVLFGESEAGSMKTIGKQTVCLGFMLDIGDIKRKYWRTIRLSEMEEGE